MSSEQPLAKDPFANLSDPVRIFRLVLLAAQQLRYVMDRRLAEADLTTQQAMLLTVLDALGGSAILGEAAEKLAMTHQNVKQLATSLTSKGFLEIEIDEKDRRARRLRPTAQSRRFWRRRGDGDERAIEELMRDFSESELRTLSRLLRKLAGAAEPVCRSLRRG
jgi:DNA-binding MarR family transcriptional regulator